MRLRASARPIAPPMSGTRPASTSTCAPLQIPITGLPPSAWAASTSIERILGGERSGSNSVLIRPAARQAGTRRSLRSSAASARPAEHLGLETHAVQRAHALAPRSSRPETAITATRAPLTPRPLRSTAPRSGRARRHRPARRRSRSCALTAGVEHPQAWNGLPTRCRSARPAGRARAPIGTGCVARCGLTSNTTPGRSLKSAQRARASSTPRSTSAPSARSAGQAITISARVVASPAIRDVVRGAHPSAFGGQHRELVQQGLALEAEIGRSRWTTGPGPRARRRTR